MVSALVVRPRTGSPPHRTRRGKWAGERPLIDDHARRRDVVAAPRLAFAHETNRALSPYDQSHWGDLPLADVFLSYARSDRSVAAEVAGSLEHAGFTVWWDREIRAGTDFALEIDREIAAARAVVVLWSDASQQSAWVRDEGGYARDRNKLIPICLGDAEPPLGFRQVQSLRLGP
jgi:hypothetical protein